MHPPTAFLALSMVPDPGWPVVLPPLIVGIVAWLVLKARRTGPGFRFIPYCLVTYVVAIVSAAIVLYVHAEATFPSTPVNPETGMHDIIYPMPRAARILLGIGLGALVPVLVAAFDRVAWRGWVWGLLAVPPAAFYVSIAVLPHDAPGGHWYALLLLAWLALLVSAFGALLERWPARSGASPEE